ncbi:hypothetical protein ACC754_37320, partial [Rhizobium johnstonii]
KSAEIVIGAARSTRGSFMHNKETDYDRAPDLLAHYRPLAIRAVAASLTLKLVVPLRIVRARWAGIFRL